MQKEKLAAIVLVIVIIVAISGFLVVNYNEQIRNALFPETPKAVNTTIAFGDCVDINYTESYTNGTIISSSYNDTTNQSGGEPLLVFVETNRSIYPPTGYDAYSSLGVVNGLIEGLVGLKQGQTVTFNITPEKAYGVTPKVGDVMNLTPYVGFPYEYQFISIQENVTMPIDLQAEFGNGTTTLVTLRENWHYIGEIVDVYPYWVNSTVVTELNETLMWIYITPTTAVGENFTYNEVNETNGDITLYPENTSSISSIDDTTIIITHNPEINSTINISSYDSYSGSYYASGSFTVQSLTADKINASSTDTTGNTTYQDFNRISTILRNQTKNITQPAIPSEFLETYFFSGLRDLDSNFVLSYSPLADEYIVYNVTIEKVYKTSTQLSS